MSRISRSRGGWAWDTKFGDFDNDGTVEVIQATGFMKGKINRWRELHELALANEELAKYPVIYPVLDETASVAGDEHNPFFVKSGERYYDIAKQLGADVSRPMLSRGVALADVDGDGRLDFALANNWEPSFFFHNRAQNPGAFLGLHLRLPLIDRAAMAPSISHALPLVPNDDDGQTPWVVAEGHPVSSLPSPPAIGAEAVVRIGSGETARTLIGQVDGGNGHSGHRAPELHFGLGDVPARLVRALREPSASPDTHAPLQPRLYDVSYHYDAAGERLRAASYALLAAEQAQRQFALDVASEQYTIAARNSAREPAAFLYRLAKGRGETLMLLGRYEEAQIELNTAFETSTGVAPEDEN